jgi:hypothetical protein
LLLLLSQLHFGVHDGSDLFKLESTAYNEADFRCPDQRGWAPRNVQVDPTCAQEELCTALDLERVADALAHFPAYDPSADATADAGDAHGKWRVAVSTDPGR